MIEPPVTITHTNHHVNLRQPDPENIDIEDVAFSLSHQNRFNGHAGNYSVALHSINLILFVPSEYALWALLHDATEAYLGDVIRPVKQSFDKHSFYIECENALTQAICEKFELEETEIPEPVKQSDAQLGVSEYMYFFGRHMSKNNCVIDEEPIGEGAFALLEDEMESDLDPLQVCSLYVELVNMHS